MTPSSAPSPKRFTVAALFGYDDVVRDRIDALIAEPGDFVAIWCGGNENELFRLKQWWLGAFESDPGKKPATLYIAPDNDPAYAYEMVAGLAERRRECLCTVALCSTCPKTFSSKTAQKLKIRALKSKIERCGLSVVSSPPPAC